MFLFLVQMINGQADNGVIVVEAEHAIGDSRLRPDGIRVHSDEYSWSGLPKGPGARTPQAIRNNQVYFEIQETGTYTPQIVSRSIGFKLDKIVLQQEKLPSPEDTGPAEVGLAYDPLLRTGIWDRFEASLNGDIEYQDPYQDVTLHASFFSPTGRMIKTKGFYNGNQEWKMRFMTDEIGIWEYEIFSSDSTMRQSGEFECMASDIPGMISVYENNPICGMIMAFYRDPKPLTGKGWMRPYSKITIRGVHCIYRKCSGPVILSDILHTHLKIFVKMPW